MDAGADSPTITAAYREMNRRLLEENPKYATTGHTWGKFVLGMCQAVGSTDILDYGCGRQTLAATIADETGGRVVVRGYDPAVPGLDAMPEPADIVTCTDVMEHIEPEKLDAVLAHIHGLARRAAMFTICTKPARNSILPDGRNPHLIIEGPVWWTRKLMDAGFEPVRFMVAGPTLVFHVKPIRGG